MRLTEENAVEGRQDVVQDFFLGVELYDGYYVGSYDLLGFVVQELSLVVQKGIVKLTESVVNFFSDGQFVVGTNGDFGLDVQLVLAVFVVERVTVLDDFAPCVG